METVYLVLVIMLFALAISDLVVGVSNDAVNFLNSAIGAKAASFKVIILIAAFGVLLGATFSSGMMEVARKGIFNPSMFTFDHIMIIFLAVMITDVILLDLFNTIGLPTSTTVSIVFELLGSAVAVSVMLVAAKGGSVYEYINSAKALTIISGILLSIAVSFSVGALVQYVTRLLFTFNYQKTFRYYGSVWGGIAITAITYFILIKGAKDASFMTEHMNKWVQSNTLQLIALNFAFWTVVLQLLMWLTRINILKVIVLIGTFALAMAFAGNDLVNFIGVPLAGFKSYQGWVASGVSDPGLFGMGWLAEKVKTESYLLLIAGLIMVITLYKSKKARSVTKTSLDLSRQDAGEERFGSSLFARGVVRGTLNLAKVFNAFIPDVLLIKINKRFDHSEAIATDGQSFDLMRASVNLAVASILISFATSLKLPLSTTYVTFMVAMGTSLSDRAWGRESAVYRITGVMTVIGGWFFTAFMAFSVSFLFAMFIFWGGMIAVGVLIVLAIVFIIKTHTIHKEKAQEENNEAHDPEASFLDVCNANLINNIESVTEQYSNNIYAFINEDRKKLKEANKEARQLTARVKQLKDKIRPTLRKLREDDVETGHYYVQVLDYVREMVHCITHISDPVFEHIDNNHKGFKDAYIKELKELNSNMYHFDKQVQIIISDQDFDQIDELILEQQRILDLIKEYNVHQIKRLKREPSSTRNSMLYLGILSETKNLLLHTVNMVKAYRDFIKYDELGTDRYED